MSVVHFNCPDCARPCRVDEVQRAVQHSNPVCKTWVAHRGKGEEFLKLTLQTMSVENGNLILGATADHEPGKPPSAAERKLRDETLEQIYEGMKKL